MILRVGVSRTSSVPSLLCINLPVPSWKGEKREWVIIFNSEHRLFYIDWAKYSFWMIIYFTLRSWMLWLIWLDKNDKILFIEWLIVLMLQINMYQCNWIKFINFFTVLTYFISHTHTSSMALFSRGLWIYQERGVILGAFNGHFLGVFFIFRVILEAERPKLT